MTRVIDSSSDGKSVPSVDGVVTTGVYIVTVTAPFEFGGARLGPLVEISASGEWLAALLASEFADKVASAVLES